MREATLQTPRPEEKEGRRCSRHRSRDSPAACGAAHGEAGCAPAPWRPMGEQIPTCTRGGPHAGAGGAQRRL